MVDLFKLFKYLESHLPLKTDINIGMFNNSSDQLIIRLVAPVFNKDLKMHEIFDRYEIEHSKASEYYKLNMMCEKFLHYYEKELKAVLKTDSKVEDES